MPTKLRKTQSGYGRPDLRFWLKVNKDGPIHPVHGQCWVWTAGKFSRGYGQLSTTRGNLKAHRFSWELHRGEIPEGQKVLQKCDNPACVNPDHLFLGTNGKNSQDMVEKDRQAKGEDHGVAALTEKGVRWIRRNYRRYSRTHGTYALAKKFGVSQTAVMVVVVAGKYWKHVR